MDPKCASILCGFSDGVVRYLSVARDDGSAVRNRRSKSNLNFQLLQVFKPHTKSVTSIVIDKHGKMLATGVSFYHIIAVYNCRMNIIKVFSLCLAFKNFFHEMFIFNFVE